MFIPKDGMVGRAEPREHPPDLLPTNNNNYKPFIFKKVKPFLEIEKKSSLLYFDFPNLISFSFFFLDLQPKKAWGFNFICTVLQCDLTPLRSHCGEAPARESNPGCAI